MTSAIAAFIKMLDDYPGWREWNREKFGHTLHFDDDFLRPEKRATEFKFEHRIEAQHTVIMRYISLLHTPAELSDLKHYFRRFPFGATSITRYAHLSNCCELYFSRFFQYKERLKELFDAVDTAAHGHNLAVGKFIKAFDREFNAEIRERHSIHHRQRFEDLDISRLLLIEQILQCDTSMADKGWVHEQRRAYRKAANAWATRCVTQSERLDTITEAVAEALLKVCDFLKPTKEAS